MDEYNILEGVVSLDDVREIMFRNELYETTLVRDLMSIPPSYIDKRRILKLLWKHSGRQEHGTCLFLIMGIMLDLSQNQGFLQLTVSC